VEVYSVGILLVIVGAVWAGMGTIGVLYGIFRITPAVTSTLSDLAALSPQFKDFISVSGARLTINAIMAFTGVQAFIVPGLIIAGIGSLIKLQQRSSS
jgi:hypothetical protein